MTEFSSTRFKEETGSLKRGTSSGYGQVSTLKNKKQSDQPKEKNFQTLYVPGSRGKMFKTMYSSAGTQ